MNYFIRRFLCIILLLTIYFGTNAQINFPYRSVYKFLKGSDAEFLGSDWMNTGFDDSGWTTSSAPFHYGDGTGGTELTDMQGNYSTIFLRTIFTAANIDDIDEITISIDWDDGFVLFINGMEVVSRQAPDVITFDALSIGLHEYGEAETIIFPAGDIVLNEGDNTLAVFACNTSLSGSSDFYIDVTINAVPELPGLTEFVDTVGVSFSQPSGFYNDSITVTLTSPVADANIVYTLDGSNPQTSFSSIKTGPTTQILIDPNDYTYRGATAGVVVRASIVKDGFMPSKPSGRTYLFIDEVRNQTFPGWDWPAINVNQQHIDYDMDSNVVNSAEYKDLIEDALLDIPSISIITDNYNLFDPAYGIYVNAMQQGRSWERDCTVELLNPDGSEGFNINAGLRIRGGWSRHPEYAKHAFRLFFRTEYGEAKLNFPLFGDEGVDHFDKVDLRCAQNYGWNNSSGEHNTFIREVFLRDAQGDAGSPYTKSRYYHLYLNGLYWGLFQTQERSEARFASDYFGGANEDWDVVKRGGVDNNNVVATDGNLDKWQDVWDITTSGYSGNANYFLLEGRDMMGRPMKNSEILVDIDNLIDYMINIFYSGNFDAPVSKFGQNKMPNNFFALKQRDDKTTGFFFMVHDAEHTLMYEPISPGIGINENRVNIGYLNNYLAMEVNTFYSFHPQWLHHKLVENKEYKARFANLAYKRLNDDYGIFSEQANLDRLNARADQIDLAIIAESARWGDCNTYTAYTKADWEKELNVLRNQFFDERNAIVIDQLKEYGLYPVIDAPDIIIDGNNTFEEFVIINDEVSLSFKSSEEIYYTIDGSDPRALNDNLSQGATKIGSDQAILVSKSAVIKVRAIKGTNWSAMREINLVMEQQDFSHFKVTELNYHPTDSIIGTDTISGKDYEFIEFKNTSFTDAINLSGVSIDSSVRYTFPENYLLPPQQYVVLAARPKKFYDRYGMIPNGNFKKSFSNSGEQVLLTNKSGSVIMDFTYDDIYPWPEIADGGGASLMAVEENPTGDPNDYTYWTASKKLHGSPIPNGYYNSIEDRPAESLSDNFILYPNPTNGHFYIDSYGELFESFKVELYDINGRIVLSKEVTKNASVSLKDIQIDYGVYLVRIMAGELSDIRKLVYVP